MRKLQLLLFFFLFVTKLNALAQDGYSGIKDIISSIDNLNSRFPIEKLYLHFDKPYYSIGDTIWFKAYLFDGIYFTPSKNTGLAYLELRNDTGKVLLQRMFTIHEGLGRGNIPLPKDQSFGDDLTEGSYTIRAYTNHMRNFNGDYVFKKNVYIGSSTSQSWLVNTKGVFVKESGTDYLRLGMQFRGMDKNPVNLRDMQIRARDGKKVLFSEKLTTDANGLLDINLSLPEKFAGRVINITAEDLTTQKQATQASNPHRLAIPIQINRYDNTDVQFMPEGGDLVNGIATRVAFKALSEDGKGVDVSGTIYSRDGAQVTLFSSTHKGMGSFEFVPKEDERYTARIIFPDGSFINDALINRSSFCIEEREGCNSGREQCFRYLDLNTGAYYCSVTNGTP